MESPNVCFPEKRLCGSGSYVAFLIALFSLLPDSILANEVRPPKAPTRDESITTTPVGPKQLPAEIMQHFLQPIGSAELGGYSETISENGILGTTNTSDGIWASAYSWLSWWFHTAVYDPVRDRMVIVGGWDSGPEIEVWELSLDELVWEEIIPAGNPPAARNSARGIYDPIRDRIIIFGGEGFKNDTWALSLSGTPMWTELSPVGIPPTGRSGHTAIYDPIRDRMVVFGGYDGSNENDIWALSLSGMPTWAELSPVGILPTGRSGHTAIYDPIRDRMVVFGGSSGSYLNETWALSFAGTPEWIQLSPSGSLPTPRHFHAAAYDAGRDMMVVFGGVTSSGGLNDTWRLSLASPTSWTALAPSGTLPSGRFGHTTIIDQARDRLIALGGNTAGLLPDDAHALALSGATTWTLLSRGPPPPGLVAHVATYDPGGNQMVVFGGHSGYNGVALVPLNDTYALSFCGKRVWTRVFPAGESPSARWHHSAILDPLRRKMMMFGGWDGAARNDTWELTLEGLPAWTQLSPSGNPPTGRYGQKVVYDPVRDRMLLFGGFDGSSRNDIWALSLGGTHTWTQLSPSGTPPAGRYYHSLVYDSLRDQVVVFGGWNGSSVLNDVWALSLAGPIWTQLSPSGTPPAGRYYHSAIYDPLRDRMVVFGGYNGSNFGDAWGLSLTPQNEAWMPLPSSTARLLHTAVYDAQRDQMIVFGGNYWNDSRALVWGSGGTQTITVTTDARARHESDPLLPVPLGGVSVLLRGDGAVVAQDTTDNMGIASFVEIPCASSYSFDLELANNLYVVHEDFFVPSPVVENDVAADTDGSTAFNWPENRGTQVAHYLDRFQGEFWLERFGYQIANFGPIVVKAYGQEFQWENFFKAAAKTNPFRLCCEKRGQLQPLGDYCLEGAAIMHEYTHFVVMDRFTELTQPRFIASGAIPSNEDEGAAMDEALADYFAASFLEESVVDDRNLATFIDKYPTASPYNKSVYDGSKILSGSLWDLRQDIGASAADALAFDALDRMIQMNTSPEAIYTFEDYFLAIVMSDSASGGAYDANIILAFGAHNIGPNADPNVTALAWAGDDAFTDISEPDVETIGFNWKSIAGAATYELRVATTNYDRDDYQLASYVTLASGIADTLYVFGERDQFTEYLFSVVAVDSANQVGGEANPVFLPALNQTGIGDTPVRPGRRGRFLLNSPNPSATNTRILFELTRRENVRIDVFTIEGRLVRQVENRLFESGRQFVVWDGANEAGQRLGSGVYLVRIVGQGWQDGGKIVLLR